MYKLIMCTANIKHKDWWWDGKPAYQFITIEGLIDFMKVLIPVDKKDIESIRKNDKKKTCGRLACTSWYEVKKGEDLMTEYTSF